MSATNRGADRVTSDNYPTPAWATRRLLGALREHLGIDIRYATVLEPCCGEGAIIRVLRSEGARGPITGVDTRLEALPYARGSGATHVIEARAQAHKAIGRYELAITNPPFDQAADTVEGERSIIPGIIIPGIINATLANATVCAFLLRSSFRLGAFRDNMPDEFKFQQRLEFVASYRCKFITSNGNKVDGCGWAAKVPLTERIAHCPECNPKGLLKTAWLQRSTSDSAEYSWFVWSDRGRSHGLVRVLPDTPLEERKALEAAA